MGGQCLIVFLHVPYLLLNTCGAQVQLQTKGYINKESPQDILKVWDIAEILWHSLHKFN